MDVEGPGDDADGFAVERALAGEFYVIGASSKYKSFAKCLVSVGLLVSALSVERNVKHSYNIDRQEFIVDLDKESDFQFGNKEVLIHRFGDLTQTRDWFSEGFSIENSSQFYDVKKLYAETEKAIINIIRSLDPSLTLDGFSLEQYHAYVDDDLHAEVIKKTKRLFPEDLDLNVSIILEEFSKYFNPKLTFLNPITGSTQWMIARINKPNSNNYNTVHKDVYESFDRFGDVPRMVNVWIPLCGVDKRNSLPLVPGSHLIPEQLIKRTKAGSTMNGIPYSVASIQSWDGKNSLSRAKLSGEKVLIFSSHLIHGLAVNQSEDITRISFEFRLYEETRLQTQSVA